VNASYEQDLAELKDRVRRDLLIKDIAVSLKMGGCETAQAGGAPMNCMS
jgi:hypothetical protein